MHTVIKDVYVICSNAPALLLGIYYVTNIFLMGARGSALPPSTIRIMLWILSIGGILNFIMSIVAIAAPLEVSEVLIGINCNIWTVFMYAAGMTSLTIVIRSQTSNTIDPNMLMALTLNGCLWTMYGIGLSKLTLILPNVLGLILCGIQFFLLFYYPRTNSNAFESIINKDGGIVGVKRVVKEKKKDASQ